MTKLSKKQRILTVKDFYEAYTYDTTMEAVKIDDETGELLYQIETSFVKTIAGRYFKVRFRADDSDVMIGKPLETLYVPEAEALKLVEQYKAKEIAFNSKFKVKSLKLN